jgi:hypothetical protein
MVVIMRDHNPALSCCPIKDGEVGGFREICFLYSGGIEIGYSSAHSAHDSPVEILIKEILDPAHEGVGDWRLDSSCRRSLLRKSL